MTGPETVPTTPPDAVLRDPDSLLEGYSAARAQEALFEVRGPGSTGYDEFVDEAGELRPDWRELGELIGDRGRDGLDRSREVLRTLVDNDGITYTDPQENMAAEDVAPPGRWHLDGIPLLLAASDWVDTGTVADGELRLRARYLEQQFGPVRNLTLTYRKRP